jgi:hypothetical protein
MLYENVYIYIHILEYFANHLGPTAMKFRHMEALGYIVKEMPYWTYDLNHKFDTKQMIIKKLLKEGKK